MNEANPEDRGQEILRSSNGLQITNKFLFTEDLQVAISEIEKVYFSEITKENSRREQSILLALFISTGGFLLLGFWAIVLGGTLSIAFSFLPSKTTVYMPVIVLENGGTIELKMNISEKDAQLFNHAIKTAKQS